MALILEAEYLRKKQDETKVRISLMRTNEQKIKEKYHKLVTVYNAILVFEKKKKLVPIFYRPPPYTVLSVQYFEPTAELAQRLANGEFMGLSMALTGTDWYDEMIRGKYRESIMRETEDIKSPETNINTILKCREVLDELFGMINEQEEYLGDLEAQYHIIMNEIKDHMTVS